MVNYATRVFWIITCLAADLAWAQNYSIVTIAGGALPPSGTLASKASIGDPPRVALDPAGNVYFGSLHSVFKVDATGALIRLAGNGRPGYSGDGGPALAAQFLSPAGIVADASGNLYISDLDTNTVRKVSASGIISTYAGNGTAGYTGDGGPAAAAQLDTPDGLALDTAGNLYIADRNNQAIRVVSPGGNIRTLAGNGLPGFMGDGGAAVNAELNSPTGVALDSSGNLYIADTENDRIRMVTPAGTITTVAGVGNGNALGDSGPPLAAGLFLPTGLAIDSAGNLYIADYGNSRIRLVSGGQITTVAGSNSGAPLGNGGNALSVALNGPTGVAVDAAGNIYFTEGAIGSGSGLGVGDHRVWKVSSDGTLSALAGNGDESFSGDGGDATSAQMLGPTGVTTDSAGNIYIADTGNHRVRMIGTDGVIRTIAGTGQPGYSGDGGPAAAAQLNSPAGLVYHPAGLLIIADSGNSRLRAILPNGLIYTLIGNGNSSYYGDGLDSLHASLNHPQGVAVAPNREVYFADTQNNSIRKRDPNGIISTVAGTGSAGFSGDGGAATSALLNGPTSVSVDAAGNVYIVDTGNQRLREVTVDGVIHTVASSLPNPGSVTADAAGNVFVTASGNHRVWKITADSPPSPVAGTGGCCYSGDGGSALNASLDAPWGLAADASSGTLYLTDSASNAVRALLPATAAPSLSSVVNGASNLSLPVAPGEVVVLFGSGLGPQQLTVGQATSGQYPSQLADTVILFNGAPAPIVYTSSSQVAAIVPNSITAGTNLQVAVTYRDLLTSALSVTVAAVSPGIFTLDSSGKGQAAATNSDGSVNSAARPAAGSITLYVTGISFGSAVQATVNGIGANTLAFDVGTGVSTVAVQLPTGVAGSAVPVMLQVDGVSSQAGVTIAVAAN